jgi:hypothetical protein
MNPARGDWGRSSGGRFGRSGETSTRMQSWSWLRLGFFTGLWIDVAFGRPRPARGSVLRMLYVRHLSRLLFLCLPCFRCFLFVHLYLSPRVDPLHDV